MVLVQESKSRNRGLQGMEVCEICQGITSAVQTVILGALAARLTLTDTALAGSHPDCFTNN